MKFLVATVSAIIFVACAHSPKPEASRTPSSDKTAHMEIPVTDIEKIEMAGDQSSTNCTLANVPKSTQEVFNKRNPGAKIFDCTTMIPMVVHIDSPSVNLKQAYEFYYKYPIFSYATTEDLEKPEALKKFQKENVGAAKEYFEDLKSGCMGATAYITFETQKEITIEAAQHFGQARCYSLKKMQQAKGAVSGAYHSVVNFAKGVKKTGEENAKAVTNAVVETVAATPGYLDSLQKTAREKLADSIQETANSVRPEKK